MAARLFHKLKLLDKAEELYIGALVLDPEVRRPPRSSLPVLCSALSLCSILSCVTSCVVPVFRVSARVCSAADRERQPRRRRQVSRLARPCLASPLLCLLLPACPALPPADAPLC